MLPFSSNRQRAPHQPSGQLGDLDATAIRGSTAVIAMARTASAKAQAYGGPVVEQPLRPRPRRNSGAIDQVAAAHWRQVRLWECFWKLLLTDASASMSLSTADISVQLLMDTINALQDVESRITARTFSAVIEPTQGPAVRATLDQLLAVLDASSPDGLI